MNKPRVAGLNYFPSDAPAFYRAGGTVPYLRDIEYSDLPLKFTWNDLINKDVILVPRPFGGNFPDALQFIKLCNKKIWLEFDDNFFHLPKDNPSYEYYQNKEDIEKFIKILDVVDVISFSTHALKNYYESITSSNNKTKMVVIPNSFNDYISKFEYNFSNNPIVHWRGSNTHNEDFKTIIDPYVEIIKEFPNFNFTFLGKLGAHLKDKPVISKRPDPKTGVLKEYHNLNPFKDYVDKFSSKNVAYIPEIPLLEYFPYIKKLNPLIQVVPLTNNIFNKCKSNLAWLESTFSGAVTIAPDMPEWRMPGVILYNSASDFHKIMRECLTGKIDLRRMYEMSFLYIKNNLLLSKVNQQRMDLIQELVKYE